MSLWTYQRAAMWGDDIALFKDTISKSPGKSRPYNHLGVALREKNHLRESLPYFEKAVQLDPENPETHHNLGVAYESISDTDKAIKHYQRAIEFSPYAIEPRLHLATMLTQKGRYQEAMIGLSIVLEIAPNNIEAINKLQFVKQLRMQQFQRR